MNSQGKKTTKGLRVDEIRNFTDMLHSMGMRVTPERIALREVMASRPGKYFSARELSEALSEAGVPVKTATVYNTIAAFERLGLTGRRRLAGDSANTYTYLPTRSGTTSGKNKLEVELALECQVCRKVKVIRDSKLTNHLRRHRFTGFDTSCGTANIHVSCTCKRCKRLSETKISSQNDIHS